MELQISIYGVKILDPKTKVSPCSIFKLGCFTVALLMLIADVLLNNKHCVDEEGIGRVCKGSK